MEHEGNNYTNGDWCYLKPPCLTLNNIWYVSRVKWNNPRKEVARSPTARCSSYWKGSLLVILDYGRQLLLIYIYILADLNNAKNSKVSLRPLIFNLATLSFKQPIIGLIINFVLHEVFFSDPVWSKYSDIFSFLSYSFFGPMEHFFLGNSHLFGPSRPIFCHLLLHQTQRIL